MATSRESTTTGRLPISGGSHHQTSPRAGSAFTPMRLASSRTSVLWASRGFMPRLCDVCVVITPANLIGR